MAATLTVPIDHATIQAAINAAAPGDTINVNNGTYNEILDITKSLTIVGQSEAGTIINATDTNAYAVNVLGVNNVTLQNLTFTRTAVTNCTPANTTACFGLKISGSTGNTFQGLTITGSPRTGLDFNGVDNSVIDDVTVTNTTYGTGIGLTDSDNNMLSNITTSGNSFSGMAIFTSTFYPPAGSSGNVLTGTNSFSEPTKVYYQKANPADPITFIATGDFNFVVLSATPGTESVGVFTNTLAEAITAAEALATLLGGAPASPVVIQEIANPGTTYPDTDLGTAGYQSGDIIAPVFSSLTFIARDTSNVPKGAIGGSYYLSENERIFFTININPNDTMAAGNNIDFTIGGAAKSTSAFILSPAPTTAGTRNRNYFIQAGENGAVGITGINFTDDSGNAITGLPAFPLATSIIVDTTAPTLDTVVQSTNNVYRDKWAREGEVITYDLTFSEPITVSINAASAGTNVSTLTQELDASATTTDQLIFTAAAGDNGVVSINVDFDITDRAGNVTNITSLGSITSADGSAPVETDTENPILNSVNIVSDNSNDTAWSKTGDTITITTAASELLRSGLTQTVVGTIATESATMTKLCGGTNCDAHQFTLLTDGNEAEGVVPFTINFQDRAGNPGVAVTASTDASSVTIDNTAPTLPLVSITSNNALDTTLAKSNDTITVTYTVADNLATMATINGAPTILSNPAVSGGVVIGAGNTITRFTDGSETSEVVVPFSFAVMDQAGNISATTTATTDASQVQFDRTEPLISLVRIVSISQDASAFQGDLPTYYAKQGDNVRLVVRMCDYVDGQNNPPTGTFFGQAVTLIDAGLVGAPGNCTTPEGNLSQTRDWRGISDPADGTEGIITFDITVKDNAGNEVANVTTTTDGTSVIFDKTAPTAPTDMVDLGGAATLSFKPAPNADLYTWTNDTDPAGGPVVSGVHQFNVRYNNVNTGINEQVTLTAPTRSFAPTLMIPDLAPYTVNMEVRDKAGNLSTEAVVYSQKYGIEITGKVSDNKTGLPIEGAIVNAISGAGTDCNAPGQEVCGAATDGNGDYVITVAPNTLYKLDATKVPRYYIAKSDLNIQVNDVVSNIGLEPVAEGEIQTGKQGTVITTNAEFSLNGLPQTTYITVFSQSGDVSTKVTPQGIEITSFGTINEVTSNNPDVVIQKIAPNTYLVTNAGKIINTSDNQNRGSSVSSTFASGSNRVGVRRAQGGSNAGFQVGMRREDRVVNGGRWTYAESMAFAERLNQGSSYKVMQRENRNGFMVFAGYQNGRLAMSDMTGSNPQLMLKKQVIYRGPRRGTERTFRNIAIADRKEVVHSLFKQEEDGAEPEVLVVEEGNQQKAARPIVETKKTELTYDNPDITGFGRVTSVFPGVYNKRENDARYVNKFERVPTPSTVAPSRLRGKNVDMIVFKSNNKRGGKKLALGQLFNENPQLITQRERVVVR
jgi:hypothetical protein